MSARVTFLVLLVASLALVGCHRPHGALMPYSGGSHTYFSTETQPKSVRLIDIRTDEVIFSMDIPPGKQLTLDFVEGGGDDPVYSPDTMRYEVFDLGTTTGKLRSAMNVPASWSRKLEVYLRQGIEYIPASSDRALRTDELADRPEWWTPAGGALPEDEHGIRNYDQ
jgi:hypothetical protein